MKRTEALTHGARRGRSKKTADAHTTGSRIGPTARVACVRVSCAECYATLKFAGNYMGEACDGCLKSSMPQIDACVVASRATTSVTPVPVVIPALPAAASATKVDPRPTVSTPAARMPAVAATQTSPVQPASFEITRLEIVPATVAAGGRFSLSVAYTAPTAGRVEFAFAISAGGRELFASKPESIEGGNGKPMRHERSLGAASAPGIYTILVTLTLDGKTVEREASLTVSISRE